jgi:hypothetical protein
MGDKNDASYYDGVQRFLADLRCSAERRASVDRRRRHKNVIVERRAGEERRIYQERRQSLSNYSTEDTLDIKAMVLDPGSRVACPECNGSLMLGPPVAKDGLIFRRVHCTSCRRSLILETPPSSHR